MAKKYSVKPVLRKGRKFYIANYRIASGKKVCRGLGTPDEGQAEIICAGLVRLWKSGARTVVDAPLGVCPEAVKLYFGQSDKDKRETIKVGDGDEWTDTPPHLRSKILELLSDRLTLKNENELLRTQLATTRRDLDVLQKAHNDLKSASIAQAVKLSETMPPIKDAVRLYENHIKATCSDTAIQRNMSRIRRFISEIPQHTRNISEITPQWIIRFLDEKTAGGDRTKSQARRHEWRTRIAGLLNWSATEFGYISQMKRVPTVSANKLHRERGGIHWHPLEGVEKVVNQQDAYFASVIACLGYAGLRLNELVWLRKKDVDLTENKIIVTSVEDGEERHLLKTGNSERVVKIHNKYLLPRLEKFVQSKLVGNFYFFAVPKNLRRTRGNNENPERWLRHSLTVILKGHKGGKNRTANPGILPDNMSALSLRRTFGSLLLRSGKSVEQVAAAMGNTPEIVSQHYAKILGSEVDIDF